MRRACIICTVALGLAVCISILFCSTESVEIQAATGSFNVSAPTPTPTLPPITPTPSPSPTPSTSTPEPSPTPTATPTVSPTPTSTSSGSGSGSSQPSISLKLSIDIMGEKTESLRNSAGKVIADVTATSADGKITLKIYEGTFALDADGEPLTEIYVTVVNPFVKAPPAENQFIYMYQLSPDGATFSQPIDITINYNPADLPKAPEQSALKMYSFDNAPDEWKEIPCLVDIGINTVSLSINHLSIYVLSVAPLEDPAPTPQDSPMSDPTSSAQHSNWILLILILPAASLMFFIYALVRWWRGNSVSEEAEL
jgi:hypothetical protein